MKNMHKNCCAIAITAIIFSPGLAAEALAAKVKLHPLESYTAIFSQKGSFTGEYKEYCRNYCFERVQVENFSIQMGGMKLPPQKKRTISNGAATTTIDLSTGRVTEINNPFFDDMVARARGKGPVEAAKEFLRISGTSETQETATIGKWSCTIWSNPGLGLRICMTKDMIPVQTQTNIAGMQFTRTLVRFTAGDPGPDEVYKVPDGMTAKPLEIPAGIPPNMKALLESLMPKQN